MIHGETEAAQRWVPTTRAHTTAAGLTGDRDGWPNGAQRAWTLPTAQEEPSQSCFELSHCTKKTRATPNKILGLP